MSPFTRKQKRPLPADPSVHHSPDGHNKLGRSGLSEASHTIPHQGPALSTNYSSPDCSTAVSAAALAHWQVLPKNGKPQPNEHTVVAAFVMESPREAVHGNSNISASAAMVAAEHEITTWREQPAKHFTVVALGSGTKCLSSDARCPGGTLLNDSHAEIIARRALQRWLYSELNAAAKSMPTSSYSVPASGSVTFSESTLVSVSASASASAFMVNGCGELSGGPAINGDVLAGARKATVGSQFFSCTPSCSGLPGTASHGWHATLRPGCQLHMWVSQTPCGDASIFGAHKVSPLFHAPQRESKVAATFGVQPGQRTGAKLIQTLQAGDPCMLMNATQQVVPAATDVESAAAVQQTGVLRRKPGRGAATLSMSCSDKLARWACLGVQGALLMDFLAVPLHLASLTVALPFAGGEVSTSESHVASPADSDRPSAEAWSTHAAAAVGALRRAIEVRTALVGSCLQPPHQRYPPRVHVVPGPHSDLGLYPTSTRTVPSGTSVNWSAGCTAEGDRSVHEVTLSGSGRKAGAAKKEPATPKTRSRLCKAAMFGQWAQMSMLSGLSQLSTNSQLGDEVPTNHVQVEELDEALIYCNAKRSAGGSAYAVSWCTINQEVETFKSWIHSPPLLEEFLLKSLWQDVE